MVVVALRYPAYMASYDEVAERCQALVPAFESEIPGLINKTWGMNEESGAMCPVYHFEDRASAEAADSAPEGSSQQRRVIAVAE